MSEMKPISKYAWKRQKQFDEEKYIDWECFSFFHREEKISVFVYRSDATHL